MNDRYLYKAKKKNWRELPTEEQWVVGYIVHRPTGEWEILGKCNNPPDCDPMWRKVLIAYEIDPSTICRCTGLKDKNEKLIWENDIVRCKYDDDYGGKGEYTGKVIFREDICAFVVTDMKSTNYQWWNEDKEVIGNKFDNPEMLEVEK